MSRKDNAFRRRKPAHRTAAPSPEVTSLPRAGISTRLIALVYDSLLLLALTAVVNTLLIAIATPGEAASHQDLTVLSPAVRQGLLLPATLLVIFGFYGYCWTRSGQTLGMQTWRLEARRSDGRLLTWGDSFRRCASAAAVPVLCGLISRLLHDNVAAFAVSVLSGFLFNYVWAWLPQRGRPRGRCLHDLLSHTEVVRRPPQAKGGKPYRFLGLFGDRQD